MEGHPDLIAEASGAVLPLPSTPFDVAQYADYVPSRFDYSTQGASAADLFSTGLPIDQGAAFDAEPMSQQGGNDEKFARTGTGLAQTIIGLDLGNWLGDHSEPSGSMGHGLVPYRAGEPTDDGRLPTIILRNTSTAETWKQLDDGLGVKLDAAPPLAYGGPLYDAPIVGAWASPGGSLPALPDQELALVNTYRIPPTPWDEFNYIGGPIDG